MFRQTLESLPLPLEFHRVSRSKEAAEHGVESENERLDLDAEWRFRFLDLLVQLLIDGGWGSSDGKMTEVVQFMEGVIGGLRGRLEGDLKESL